MCRKICVGKFAVGKFAVGKTSGYPKSIRGLGQSGRGSPPPKKNSIHFFLNSSKSQTNSLRMLSTKATISEKLKIATLSTLDHNLFVHNIVHLLGRKNLAKWLRLSDHISKTNNLKNRKIDFSFISEHYATYWTKKI